MTIAHKITGTGSPICLLHGWGTNGAVFEPIISQLSDNHQVINIDLPGLGASATHELVTDLDKLLLELKQIIPDNAILLGWSLGGLIAIAFAAKYQSIAKLILVASTPKFYTDDNWLAGINYQNFENFAAHFAENQQQCLQDFLELQLRGASNDFCYKSLSKSIAERPANLEQLKVYLGFLKNLDVREQLSKLSIPILSIIGNRDRLVPANHYQQIQQLNPKLQVLNFKAAAHAPFLNQPQRFCDEVINFNG